MSWIIDYIHHTECIEIALLLFAILAYETIQVNQMDMTESQVADTLASMHQVAPAKHKRSSGTRTPMGRLSGRPLSKDAFLRKPCNSALWQYICGDMPAKVGSQRL